MSTMYPDHPKIGALNGPGVGASGFVVLWGGQLVSILFSGAAAFTLSLSVFRETGSVYFLSLITAASTLGGIYFAPMAGVVSDRFRRRTFLIGSNLVLSVMSLLLSTVMLRDLGSVVYLIVALVFLAAVTSAGMSVTLAATVREVRSERDLTRINGVISLVENAPLLAAPAVGALLYTFTNASVVYAVDAVSFALCAVAVWAARWVPKHTPAARARSGNPFAGSGVGFRFILSHPGLRRLQFLFAGINFCNGFAVSSVTAFVISNSAPGESSFNLAGTSTAGSAGLFIGALAVVAVGKRFRRGVVVGGATMIGGLAGRVGLALTGIPLLWFLLTAVRNASVQLSAAPLTAVWQERTPPSIQASVFGARRLIGQGGYPLAILMGGWVGGRLTPVTSLAGTGLGGLAGLILVSGIAEIVWGALLMVTPSVREIMARPAEE